MRTIILLAFVAGAFAQYTVEQQQLLLQQQQPLGALAGLGPFQFQQPFQLQQPFQFQQPFLYPGLQGYNGVGLGNQVYNPLVNNPYLIRNPYLPITGLPAVETLKEIDILKPSGLSGSVEMGPLDAVIMDNKNKGVGHHEIYSWQRSALPNAGRSSMEQSRFLKPGNRPNWWSFDDFANKKRFSSPPFTVNNPEHVEIYEYV